MSKNWYPSHMSKVKISLIESLKSCDTVIEVIDARLPKTSRNVELQKLIQGKNRVIVINKSDLIEKEDLEKMEKHFKKHDTKYTIGVSATTGQSMKRLYQILDMIFDRKKEKMARKRIRTNALPIRAMIVGIPNVGKSRIINCLTGRKVVGVADKAGFTRGKQWIRVLPTVELLDTPGVLWIGQREEDVKKLAIINSMSNKATEYEDAATYLVDVLPKDNILQEYGIEPENKDTDTIIAALAVKWNKEEEDVSKKLLQDYRDLKLGKVVLESL